MDAGQALNTAGAQLAHLLSKMISGDFAAGSSEQGLSSPRPRLSSTPVTLPMQGLPLELIHSLAHSVASHSSVFYQHFLGTCCVPAAGVMKTLKTPGLDLQEPPVWGRQASRQRAPCP